MPAGNSLRTSWQPASPIPLPEYPRPQMIRPNWLNLNGWWEYAITPQSQNKPETMGGKILVPYAVESLLSGVQRPLLPEDRLWYHRRFSIPQNWNGNHILLHFGAVDYSCQVWVNGISVGTHTGGFVPFTFDITGALNGQENDLLIAVDDPSDSQLQARGKQKLQPRGIWYTAVSGIWQTVWLEPVPDTSIASLKITPDLDAGTVRVEAELRGSNPDLTLRASVMEGGREIAACQANPNEPLVLTIPNPHPWSPQDPHLYPLHLQLERNGFVLDEVESYFAIRKFSLVKDKLGNQRFALNNKPLFLFGPLDQGYFPDGLYTPPSEEAMLFDIEFTRNIGCNMIRKHVKVEPSRWYYHCDRLGMIVWQDMPNGGTLDSDIVAYLAIMANLKRRDTGRQEKSHREQFLKELREMVDHLYSFPCIGAWVPFNESWGQFDAKEVAEWLKTYDPTRLVDHASGWFDQGGGDFKSKHFYFKRMPVLKPDARRAAVISEFGGYSLLLRGHTWDEDKKFGYRFFHNQEALTSAYLDLLHDQLEPLVRKGVSGAIYTQTTDVEIEINGYLTYDRQVEKMDAGKLQQAHTKLIALGSDG